MNRRELEMHLQELFEGRLMGDDLEELQHELRTNPEAKDAYCDYAHLHNALQLRNEGVDSLNVIPMDRAIQRDQRRNFRTAMLISVAVVAIIGVVMSLFIARTPPPTLRFSTSPGTDLTISHQLTGEGAPEGQVLEPGSSIELSRGTVELEFASGVRGIIQGPAAMTLRREDLLELDKGTAWFEVPPEAIGFKVSTAEMVVTDLGTEFGIRSRANAPDEVHVFSGKVEILHRKGVKKQSVVTTGQARVAGPVGRWQETALRRDYFLSELPKTEPKPLVIFEDSFENPAITGLTNTKPSGWSQDLPAGGIGLNDNDSGKLNTPFGSQVMWSNGGAIKTSSLIMLEKLIGNGTYTLSVHVGRRSDLHGGTCTIELLAGDTVLATTSEAVSNSSTDFSQVVRLVYTPDESHRHLRGETLAIRLKGETQTQFDNVRLEIIPTRVSGLR
ncbi:MAG: FecR domain-containing protein [Akkermansiaceae bacterium]|nr:FecR domain-containing protein [Akkermansiaceae bacterium]